MRLFLHRVPSPQSGAANLSVVANTVWKVGRKSKFMNKSISGQWILVGTQGLNSRCVGGVGLSNLGSNLSLVDMVCSTDLYLRLTKHLVLRSRHVAFVHRS